MELIPIAGKVKGPFTTVAAADHVSGSLLAFGNPGILGFLFAAKMARWTES
jgi:hypothetical protein